MKKSVYVLGLFCAMSVSAAAQNYYDDLYYVPEQESESVKKESSQTLQDEYDDNAVQADTDAVFDGQGLAMDVDAYNRRPGTGTTAVSVKDTVAKAKYAPASDNGRREYSYADRNLDEGWVNGFNGSVDDYEYATRIIRFHSPRFSVHISSPYYWDIVYGLDSFNWNVYVDGSYAWAFPTFSNSLWWDWRFSHPYWGYGAYPYGFYSGYWGIYNPYYYGGWYGGWYNPYYWGPGYHHHRPYYGWGGRPVYHDNRRPVSGAYGSRRSSLNRTSTGTRVPVGGRYNSATRNSLSAGTRVTGTQSANRNNSYTGPRQGSYTRVSDRNSATGGNRVSGTSGNSSVRSYTRVSRDNSYSTSGTSSYNRNNSSSYDRSSSSYNRNSSSYNRSSSSSYNRSSSSYNRSSSSSYNRSSSTGSYSRGGGSGSYSRSGSSGGRR